MDEDARTRGMQRARDLGADAPRAAGDQDHLTAQGRASRSVPPCEERYRIVRAACTHAASDARIDERMKQAAHRAGARALGGRNRRAPAAGSSFERYMDIALYAPGSGYYSAGAHKLGRGGDFTTAPEISRLFGACVAQQCADVLQRMARGSILEIGAGSGRLAVDVLSRLETLGALPERYRILEISADLRERQRRAIAAAIPHLAGARRVDRGAPRGAIRWRHSRQRSAGALPVARFRWHPTYCEELGVGNRRAVASSGRRGPRAPRCERGVRRARGGGRRMAGRLRVGVLPPARGVDPGSDAGAAHRPRVVGRLWIAARPVLFSRAARRHVAMPLPPAARLTTRSSIRGFRTSRRGSISRGSPSRARRPLARSPASRRKRISWRGWESTREMRSLAARRRAPPCAARQ